LKDVVLNTVHAVSVSLSKVETSLQYEDLYKYLHTSVLGLSNAFQIILGLTASQC